MECPAFFTGRSAQIHSQTLLLPVLVWWQLYLNPCLKLVLSPTPMELPLAPPDRGFRSLVNPQPWVPWVRATS